MKRSILYVLVIFLVFAASGCGEPEREENVLKPSLACSGMKLKGETVVRYFNADGSEYITEQDHDFCVSNRSMLVTASEPTGDYIWKLKGGTFRTRPEGGQSEELLSRLEAEAINMSMLAGAGFVSLDGVHTGEPVRLSGRWYTPIEIKGLFAGQISKTVYVNRTSRKVDMVRVEDLKSGEVVSTLVFNYGYINKLDQPVPMKIEVYSTDVDSIDPKKVISFEYSKLEVL
ncbi:hypothetical protein STSP2_02891 [Anaerohalosphaera lusitana]|uniref:Lipoprotein n=1 Tax=Anaerohalosphaera lusitana TaxID=1936003 RepID=A0A1U9NQA8_9BACT|nr:hypothetical protein [Anaerohalosphaera lusitana]AQT69696.1 hypothetical protein STSP2_02891 [Anaerohalosphaera lusitana]